MWDIPVITDRTVLANRPDKVLHDKKREDLPTDRYNHTRLFKHSHKGTKKIIIFKDQEIEESEDKNCATCKWSIRNN